MKWLTRTKLGKFALVFGIVLAVLFLLSYATHLRSRNSAEAYRQQLKAAGEKLTIAELIPPRVPKEQNGADIFEQAAGLLHLAPSLLDTNLPPAMHMAIPGRAIVGWQQPGLYAFAGDFTTNSWEEAVQALAQYDGALQLLRQLSEHPNLDFDLDYQKGFNTLLPHLAPLKRAAQLLSAAVVCNLHSRDIASAVANLRAMLAIVKGLRNEPYGISQLVRMVIVHITFTVSWELLQSPELTDRSLAVLQQDWMDQEFVFGTESSYLMERAMVDQQIQKARNASSPYEQLSTSYGGSASGSGGGSGDFLEMLAELPREVWQGGRRKTAETLWRHWWSYKDELQALQGGQVLIEAARQVRTNGFFQDALTEKDRRLKALGLDDKSRDPNWLRSKIDEISGLIPSAIVGIDRILNKAMAAEAARQLAVTAIALKRYQLKQGNWPDNLTALVPEFLPAVPVDPVDGKPLRYRRAPDGSFLLYSIGEDGLDDGGNPAPVGNSAGYSWYRARDWVWPQPIALPELQAYYRSNAASMDPKRKTTLEQFLDRWTSATGSGP